MKVLSATVFELEAIKDDETGTFLETKTFNCEQCLRRGPHTRYINEHHFTFSLIQICVFSIVT